MTVPPKWRDRRDTIRAAVPAVHSVQGDADPAYEHKRAAYELARNTTVPAGHLQSLDFLAVDRGVSSRGSAGEYVPGMNLIRLARGYGDRESRTGDYRGYNKRLDITQTLTHEIGHHQDDMLNPAQFREASSGRAEAVAENYSEKHAGRQQSVYDQSVMTGDLRTRKYMGGPNGVQDYASYRGAGKMPGETISPEELFGTATSDPGAKKFNDRMRRK